MGLGAGGFSRAGMREGLDHAAAVVTEALHSGVNLVDTAEAYGTEPAVALGIERSDMAREDVVVATKVRYWTESGMRTAAQMEAAIEARLAALDTGYIDVLQIHGVRPDAYEQVRDDLLPVLEAQRSRGRVRWVGLTEAFNPDRSHDALIKALADDCWDVVMVGFNILNQSARERVLQPAAAANVGTLIMFAVRQALRELDVVAAHLREQSELGVLPEDLDIEAEIATLTDLVASSAPTLPDLAYRFARDESGVSSVLMGTGNLDHLHENRESFLRPALDGGALERLRSLLAGVDVLNGQVDTRRR